MKKTVISVNFLTALFFFILETSEQTSDTTQTSGEFPTLMGTKIRL